MQNAKHPPGHRSGISNTIAGVGDSLHNPVFASILAARNPEKRMYGYRKAFMFWGFLNALIAMFMTMEPFRKYFAGFGWAFEYVLLLSCMMQLFAGYSLFRIPVRVPFTAVAILIMYAYTMVSGILVNSDIGRTMALAIGWQTNWMMSYVFLALAIDQAVYCGNEVRTWIKWAVIICFGLSGLIGYLQFAGSGWAREAFVSIREQVAYRPNGLTDYPSQLGFQGVVGAALIGCSLRTRNLNLWEWLGIIFFMGVVLTAQYRSLYYGGIGVLGLCLLVLIAKRDKGKAVIFTIVSACVIAAPLLLLPQKFSYGTRTAKDDPALRARQDSWKQIGPVLELRPLTGIGPDPNFILGTNFLKADHWSTTVLDNFYFTMTACYGYIGISIVIIILMLLMGGAIIRASSGINEVSEIGVASVILLLCIITYSLTTNAIVYRPVGYGLAAVLGIGGSTWKDELSSGALSGVVIEVRRLVNKVKTKLKINV